MNRKKESFGERNVATKLRLSKDEKCLGFVGIGSLILLVLMSLLLLCPIITSASSALDGSDYNKPAWIPSNYVSLSLGSMPAMDITPTGEGGSVGVSQASLKVSTTSNTGYKLYVSTLDHTTAMTSTDTNQSAAIASTNTIATASNLAPNTWGYTITDAVSDSTTYSPMPTTSTVAYDTAQASGEHYLSFAAKIDTSLPAGQYSNTVAISAIANPAVITGMMELTYMQDMTSSICHDTVGYDQNYNRDSNGSYIITPGSEVTKQLIDSRDGKEYWVAKLADGNCWMTQNLALDLNSSKALTSSDTDLNSKNSWTPTNSTIVSETLTFPSDATNVNSTYSWDLGEYVLATPNRGITCGSKPTDASPSTAGFNSVRPGQKISDNCTDFVNVTQNKWQPNFSIDNAQERTWSGNGYTYTGIITVAQGNSSAEANNIAITSGNSYDSHYLIGNYYSWLAATAISGDDLVSNDAEENPAQLKDAPDSICPKGWGLPKSGRNNTTGLPYDRADSFYKLFLVYGYPNNSTITDDPTGTGGWYQTYVGYLNNMNAYTAILYGILGRDNKTAYQNLALNPAYLIRSGYIDPVLVSASYLGYTKHTWSSTADISATRTQMLAFSTDSVYPSSSDARYRGNTVRCLAR